MVDGTAEPVARVKARALAVVKKIALNPEIAVKFGLNRSHKIAFHGGASFLPRPENRKAPPRKFRKGLLFD